MSASAFGAGMVVFDDEQIGRIRNTEMHMRKCFPAEMKNQWGELDGHVYTHPCFL